MVGASSRNIRLKGAFTIANYRPPDPEEKDLIPITAEWRGNSDFTLVPAG
jgi:hypothetical protein